MIKNLTIHGFRCFNDFTMSALAPVTIVGGNNNVGKSALLESIFITRALKDPNTFLHLFRMRNPNNTSQVSVTQIFNPLFHDFDKTQIFSIETTSIDNSLAKISVEKIYNGIISLKNDNPVLTPIYDSEGNKKFSALKISAIADKYTAEATLSVDTSISPYSNFINLKVDNPHNDDIPHLIGNVGLYYYRNIGIINVPAAVSKMTLNPTKKNLLLKTLKNFDEKIIDLNMVLENNAPYLFVTLESGRYMPINYMGDGINKFLEILVFLLNLPNGVLLIDEVENGLYYERYKEMMTILIQSALDVNCQLIMSTHNRDIIEAITDSMSELNQLDKLCYQRLGFVKNAHKSFVFSGQDLMTAFENNMEMR